MLLWDTCPNFSRHGLPSSATTVASCWRAPNSTFTDSATPGTSSWTPSSAPCEDQRLNAALQANKSHEFSNSVISTGSEPQDSVPKSRKSCRIADYQTVPIACLWLVPCTRTGLVCGKTLVPIGYNLTQEICDKKNSHCQQRGKKPGDESLKEVAMQPKPSGQGRCILSLHPTCL